jgi:hypothetical protein
VLGRAINVNPARLRPQRLERLPRTSALLAVAEESSRDFAMRKILWVANLRREEGICPTALTLMYRAGIAANHPTFDLVMEEARRVIRSWLDIPQLMPYPLSGPLMG